MSVLTRDVRSGLTTQAHRRRGGDHDLETQTQSRRSVQRLVRPSRPRLCQVKPHRIQLRRTKGWRLPPNTVVVSSPSQWGNIVKVGSPAAPDRAAAAAWYRKMITAWNPTPDELAELRGKNLACWCPLNEPCHADVLLEIANGVTARPNDPSSATRPTGRTNCNRDALAGFAAAHG